MAVWLYQLLMTKGAHGTILIHMAISVILLYVGYAVMLQAMWLH